MGFWHTGYIEFHQPVGLDEFVYQPPPPARYVCEQCAQHFANLEALRRHRFEQHPLRQPSLLVRGRAVGQLPLKVMTPLQPADVVVEDVTHSRVNGKAVAPASLGTYLAMMTQEFVDIELGNEGADSRCVLDFRIADEAHLVGVESSFLRMARDHVLTIDAVARFIQDCRSFASALPYCDGVCQYLYGVMAKERAPDSGLRPDQYTEKFLQSTDLLSGFDRPLARSVRALVAFHFNQFHDAELLSPEGPLRHASGAFAGLLQGVPWHFETAFAPSPVGTIEHLLTDQDTLQVLADAGRGLGALKMVADELQVRLRRAPAGYDRLKRALLAVEVLAARDDAASHGQARKLAREWVGTADTSVWAQTMLERLGTP
ncbi:hypothetical protein [Caballeronia sp. INDeC2]|uniref:hypothetical protein n=1 Tax=Caballeronia sp. INDeC2 TaxID=2921747 RepID=UPI0020297988|nr:hypothetical protein [Caballeronia sp. INDeC2]